MGGIQRERLHALVNGGKTIAEIAEDVGLSKTTVRHWLRRYGLRTHNAQQRRAHAGTTARRSSPSRGADISAVSDADRRRSLNGAGR